MMLVNVQRKLVIKVGNYIFKKRTHFKCDEIDTYSMLICLKGRHSKTNDNSSFRKYSAYGQHFHNKSKF